MPEAALDNWQPVWNAQVSISTLVCVNFELRPGAGDIHICFFLILMLWHRETHINPHIHTYIHFYSGICTGTGNIFIGEFCMNMLRWFGESTPKWLSFKMRLSFWLQLTYWYDQMRNKDWHFRVAWPGGEPSTSRVTGRCLIHYTTSDSVNYDGFTRTLSSVNIKSTNFEEKSYQGYNRHRDIHEIRPRS